MFRSTRDKIIDYLLDPSSVDRKVIKKMLETDPYARFIYSQEQRNIRIEAYLNNELSVPERILFEEELENDDELAQEFELRRKTNIAIGQDELVSMLNDLYENDINIDEEALPEISIPESAQKKIFHINKLTYWIAAACIAALLVSVTVFRIASQNKPLESRLYSQYYRPLNSISSEFLVNSSALNKAKQKYAEGDYSTALADFEKLPAAMDIQLEKQFFIGLSQMQLGNYPQAIQSFNKVVNNQETNEFLPLAYWYLGLSHLKTGQTDKAIEMFTWLEKNSDYKQNQVDRILRKLK